MTNPEVATVGPETKIPNPVERVKQLSARLMLSLSLTLGTGFAGAVVSETVTADEHPALAESPTDCGAVLLAGKDWMQGQGVDVRSNGKSQGTGWSCKGETETYNLNASPPQFGFGWQCVELANRLYASKGWYPQMTLGPETNYGAKWMYTYAKNGKYAGTPDNPGLEAYENGSGYIPVPGDLIIDSNDEYGHVVVVDYIEGKTLKAVEQNGGYAGRIDYGFTPETGAASQAGFTVLGYIHAKKNAMIQNGNLPFSLISEGQEVTDDSWVYTKVGGSAWPIKPKGEWTASDSQYWGNEPRKSSTEEIHAKEVGYGSVAANPPVDKTTLKIDGGDGKLYYFIGGNAYPLGSMEEAADLGVNVNAIGRIPATQNRLNQFLGRVLNLPNGSIYRYALNGRINQQYIQPNGSRKGFWVPSTPMLECIQQVQNRSLYILPGASQPYVESGVNMTSDAAGCTFPANWALSTPGGSQQFKVEGDGVWSPYKKRYYSSMMDVYLNSQGSPNYRNVASLPNIPSGPNMTPPENIFFRNMANGEVFWWSAGTAHRVNSMDALSCMGGPALTPVPPEAFDGTMPLGSPAVCEFEGKLMRDTTDGKVWFVKDGQKRYVMNTTIMNGIMGRVASTQNRLTDASRTLVNSYVSGANAYVPYGPPIFTKYSGSNEIWLTLPDGTRRHAMSLCNNATIHTMPLGELEGHAKGPIWSANATDCNKIANGQNI